MTKVITYFSQKGGCGKTTLSVVTASYLAYVRGKKVAVVDGDLQGSFYDMRTRDLSAIPDYAKKLAAKGVSAPYDIVRSDSKGVANTIERLRGEGYDFIIVDLPGQISDEGILNAVVACNYVIVPLEHEAPSLVSALKSTVGITHNLLPDKFPSSRIEVVAGIYNKVPHTQVTRLASMVPLFKEVGFTYFFRTIIGRVDNMGLDRVCTLLPPSDAVLRQKDGGLNYGSYFDEFDELVGLNKD